MRKTRKSVHSTKLHFLRSRIDILILPDDGKEIPPNINAEKIYTEELLLVSRKGFIKITDGRKYVYPSEIYGLPFFMHYREHTQGHSATHTSGITIFSPI